MVVLVIVLLDVMEIVWARAKGVKMYARAVQKNAKKLVLLGAVRCVP